MIWQCILPIAKNSFFSVLTMLGFLLAQKYKNCDKTVFAVYTYNQFRRFSQFFLVFLTLYYRAKN